jgi:hypothetical protein
MVIKSREIKTEGMGNAYRILSGKPELMKCLRRLGITWRIILKLILKKLDVRKWNTCACYKRVSTLWFPCKARRFLK